MTVCVYSGRVLVEEKQFTSEVQANRWASYWSDNGYKVRFFL